MKRLVLIFQTDQGKTMRLTLPYPREGITATDVSSAMNVIIGSNVLKGKTGKPNVVLSACVEDVVRTVLI